MSNSVEFIKGICGKFERNRRRRKIHVQKKIKKNFEERERGLNFGLETSYQERLEIGTKSLDKKKKFEEEGLNFGLETSYQGKLELGTRSEGNKKKFQSSQFDLKRKDKMVQNVMKLRKKFNIQREWSRLLGRNERKRIRLPKMEKSKMENL